MGASISVSKFHNNAEDEKRKLLLTLAKERFTEFRDAVLSDPKLKDKFRRVTNN
jgi:hypothetical protein